MNILIILLTLLPMTLATYIIKDVICEKSYFYRKFFNKQRNLENSEYKRLDKCSLENGQCMDYPGSLTVTYAEDQYKRFLVIIQATDIIAQGCWGYALQINDDLSSETKYFNMNGTTNNYQCYYFIKLGFNYEFILTPLPSGKPMTIKTKSPSLCEMEVLGTIRKRIEKQELFKTCMSPGFNERFEVAEKLCKLYPDDVIKRTLASQKNLVETECKFKLLSENSV